MDKKNVKSIWLRNRTCRIPLEISFQLNIDPLIQSLWVILSIWLLIIESNMPDTEPAPP